MTRYSITLTPRTDKDLIVLFETTRSFTRIMRRVISQHISGDSTRFIEPPQEIDTKDVRRKTYVLALNDAENDWLRQIDRGAKANVLKMLVRFYYLYLPDYLYSSSIARPQFTLVINPLVSSKRGKVTGKFPKKANSTQNKKRYDQKEGSSEETGTDHQAPSSPPAPTIAEGAENYNQPSRIPSGQRHSNVHSDSKEKSTQELNGSPDHSKDRERQRRADSSSAGGSHKEKENRIWKGFSDEAAAKGFANDY